MAGSADWIAWFLAAYFTFVAGFYACRLLFDKSRNRLLHHGDVGSRHWWGHLNFRIFRILIWGICVTRAFRPAVDTYIVVFSGLIAPWLQVTGALLLVLGFLTAVVGHNNLGEAWRSGIDPLGPARLVTNRLYAWSRNPMYLGVLTAQIGFFLALPSLFTLVCLVAGLMSVFSQVRLEETHLKGKFPSDYANYSANVSRWLQIKACKSVT